MNIEYNLLKDIINSQIASNPNIVEMQQALIILLQIAEKEGKLPKPKEEIRK